MPCREVADPGGGIDPGGGGEEETDPGELFVYDATAEAVVGSGRVCRFTVGVVPAGQTAPVTFHYATSNGSATAGTHYTNTSGNASIAVDDATVTIEVPVLEPASAAGTTKTFTLTISSPNAPNTITDATAAGTIIYDPSDPDGGGGGGEPTWERAKYQSVTLSQVPVYDQIRPGDNSEQGTCAGDVDPSGCTAYSAALGMSIFEWKIRGVVKSFDAKKLLYDSGYPGFGAWHDYTIADWIKSHSAKRCADSTTRSITGWQEIDTPLSGFGTQTARFQELLGRIRRRVVLNKFVIISMMWYDDWDTWPMSSRNYMPRQVGWPVIIKPGATGPTGHSLVIVGWNNHVSDALGGCFKVQSSHGTIWGSGGRAWLPYAYIRDSMTSTTRYRASKNSAGSYTFPWFKFLYYTP